MDNSKITSVDLFAGAGGFSLAAKNTGIHVVAAIEKNSKACASYRHNLIKKGETKLYENDILKINPERFSRDHFAGKAACDIVLSGPPCQGFSVHRIKDAGVGDPRNSLILRYFEFVAALRPKIFLMENVPGILWPRHNDFLGKFYEIGDKFGYNVYKPIVLDARNYGVPQRRKRVFVLGTRKDFIFSAVWPPAATHGDEMARLSKPFLQPWIPAAVVFQQPPPGNDSNNIHMNHTPELIKVFKSTPLNGGSRRDSNRVLSCHAGHNGHTDVYGRIDPSKSAPTMTTACINPSKGRFVHPIEHHGITVRQAARFQTFPDWFEFQGGLMAAGEQIGNAVPIRLGEILLRTVVEGIANGIPEIEASSNEVTCHG